MKVLRGLLIVLVVLAAIVASGWAHTSVQLDIARSKGVYSSAEEGMRSMIDENYASDRTVKIMQAGTNSFDGSQPHVWYVIAEVRATARADGSKLGHNGCDAPGSFFLQTKEGWVHVPEGAFPTVMGFWMKVFGMAGEGQVTPSTYFAPVQQWKFCL